MHSPAGANTSLLPIPATPQEEQKLALKQWIYCTQLSKYMYEEGLLDKTELLQWILDLLDKMRSQPIEDGILKLYLPLALQYMHDFVQSERYSRRLAFSVCKKLANLLNNMVDYQASVAAQEVKEENLDGDIRMEKKMSPYEKALHEFLGCGQHRDSIMQLSAILQVICMECPTALIWCGVGENRSSYYGSPLDHCPVAPSSLPMPDKSPADNIEYRRKLLLAEDNIKLRSRHAEARWCADKWQTVTGNSTVKLLSILDALDSYLFDRMDTNNSLETLYTKVFQPLPGISQKEINEHKEAKNEYVSIF